MALAVAAPPVADALWEVVGGVLEGDAVVVDVLQGELAAQLPRGMRDVDQCAIALAQQHEFMRHELVVAHRAAHSQHAAGAWCRPLLVDDAPGLAERPAAGEPRDALNLRLRGVGVNIGPKVFARVHKVLGV